MISQYEPTIKATIAFLRLHNVKVNNSTVNDTLQNHPDWPSLLCISDSLHKWNIPNDAARITDKKDIDLLPLPFVAHLYDARTTPLALVSELSETHVGYYANEYNKLIRENREEFLKKWEGIYLIAESNDQSGEDGYAQVKRKAFIQSLAPIALCVILVTLSFYFLQQRIVNSGVPGSVGIYIMLSIFLAGIFLTSLLLWYEIDKSNPLLQKVCTGLAKTNCNAILSGKQAKLFNWLSWSEVGFIYFSGGLLTLLFTADGFLNTVVLLSWLSILAVPYSVFSVYYQWRVAKQWCVLCITVQGLLVAAAVNAMLSDFLQTNFTLSFPQLLNAITFFLLPALAWAVVKPAMLKLQQARNTKREYLRIKFNTEIFDSLLKRQTPVTVAIDGLGIDIGNADAENVLVKVCNPYCGPCAKAHPKIERLLEEHDNLRVKIIFTTPDDDNNIATKPVKHLLAIAANDNEQHTKQALDDWYMAEKKDYDVFANKYPLNGELAKQGVKLNAMDKWCRKMKVSATPTFFLNGYQLPDAYGIEDINYFLLE